MRNHILNPKPVASVIVCIATLMGMQACSDDDDAATDNPAVALIVSYDDDRYCTQCVQIDSADQTMSAKAVIDRSEFAVASYDFGPGLGVAICGIGNENQDNYGCPGNADECFCDSGSWALFERDNADWTPASAGISATMLSDGDVIGWRWTGYDSQTFEPLSKPADLSYADICGDGPHERRCY